MVMDEILRSTRPEMFYRMSEICTIEYPVVFVHNALGSCFDISRLRLDMFFYDVSSHSSVTEAAYVYSDIVEMISIFSGFLSYSFGFVYANQFQYI